MVSFLFHIFHYFFYRYEHAAGEYQTVLKNYLSPDGAGDSNSRDSPVHTDNPPPDNRTQKFSILSKSGSNKQVNIPPSPETGRKAIGQTNANADPVIARFLVQQVSHFLSKLPLHLVLHIIVFSFLEGFNIGYMKICKTLHMLQNPSLR